MSEGTPLLRSSEGAWRHQNKSETEKRQVGNPEGAFPILSTAPKLGRGLNSPFNHLRFAGEKDGGRRAAAPGQRKEQSLKVCVVIADHRRAMNWEERGRRKEEGVGDN